MTPTAIIGDIHGCADELRALIAKIGPRAFVSLGDVLDRGPDPDGSIKALRDVDARIVLGNHEEKHFRLREHLQLAKRTPPQKLTMCPNADHLRTQALVGDDNFQWLRDNASPFIRLPQHGVVCVHAGLQAFRTPEEHAPNKICRVQMSKPGDSRCPWGQFRDDRGRPRLSGSKARAAAAKGYRWWTEWLSPGGDVVVYGHSVMPRPMCSLQSTRGVEHRFDLPNDRTQLLSVGVDTGSAFGGALSALLLPEWEVVSVPAKRAYAHRKGVWGESFRSKRFSVS